MKKRASLIVLLVIVVVVCVSVFGGCQKIVPTQANIDDIGTCIENSRNELTYTYVSKESVSKLRANVRTLTVQGNIDKSLIKAKFDDTVNLVVSSTTVSQYFGPSLASTVSKPKKALASDYKVYHFFDEKNFEIEGRKKKVTENRYHIAAINFEEFLNVESIYPYTLSVFLDKVQKVVDTKWDFSTISITRQGYLTTYKFNDIGKELATILGMKLVNSKGVEKTAFPMVMETTKNRISLVTDSKEDPSVTYTVAYGAANFGMPNYDKVY